jgi:microcystin-dependent protein
MGKGMKKRLAVSLLFLSPMAFGASQRHISGSYKDADTSAINQNFTSFNNELSNSVHKTSTETITGYKYFSSPVDFGAVIADTGTFTSLSATAGTISTLSATTLSVTSVTLNGLQYAGNPVGTVSMYVAATAPSGWKLCDGSSLSTTTYSRLFAVIGYTYGGSGANFTVPDFRGIYPKGAGTTNRAAGVNANGTAYAATLGTYSQDKMQGHKHALASGQAPLGDSTGKTADTGSGLPIGSASTINVPITDGSNGTPRTGTTTEPQNVGITFIIYAGL